MLSRITNMVSAYFDGVLPAPAENIDSETEKLRSVIAELAEKVWNNVEKMKIHNALEEVNSAIRAANRYIEIG